MIMRLAERWLEYVRTMPETGMGYRVVDIELKDGGVFKQAAVDSEYLDTSAVSPHFAEPL
jgi:hypothetical protein